MRKMLFVILSLLLVYPATLFAKQISPKNHYGFLSGALDEDNYEYLEYVGAGWLRPHPGPAVWEMIQTDDGEDYDWNFMDTIVQDAENHNLNLLITIWPFASWDQVRRENNENCLVSDNDQFLPSDAGKEKGRQEYLPYYRCNPYDWTAYKQWVTAMVERYDGDGKNDMPDLIYGIKAWEVMNEPDLQGGDDLDFYKEGTDEYYQLLRRTHRAIKKADPKSKVLIAGAAASFTDQPGYFLDFYDTLFTDHPDAKRFFNIGNIHSISEEPGGDFNVGVYDTLLREHGINKPIWVTEAGAQGMTPSNTQIEYIQLNTTAALAAGAKKLFYIHYAFGEDYSTEAVAEAKEVYKNMIEQ